MSDLEREMQMLQGMDLTGTVAPVQTEVAQPTVVPVQTTQTIAQTQPVQPAVAPVQATTTSQPTQVLNLDSAQKSVDEIPMEYVSMGQRVSHAVMDKFKAQKDENKRVAIFMPFFDKKDEMVTLPDGRTIPKSKLPYPINRHYNQDLGSFICFKGECCTYEGEPATRYLFPVIEYPIANNDATKVLPEQYGECKLKLLVAGYELYTTLSQMWIQHGESFEDFDIVITCTEQQYQNFTVMATNGTVRSNYTSFNKCVEKWLQVRDKAYTVVAKKMDPEYYKNQKGLSHPQPTTPTELPSMETILQ